MTKPLALLRIALGWLLLWAFFDKLFGLGFSTAPAKSWLAGGSPTAGFLKAGVHGPLAAAFQALSGNVAVDVLFMAALLLIGLALLLGIAMKPAAFAGSVLFLLMWLALLPPTTNPVIDDHIVYILALLALAAAGAGKTWGLGPWWSRRGFVQKHPILE